MGHRWPSTTRFTVVSYLEYTQYYKTKKQQKAFSSYEYNANRWHLIINFYYIIFAHKSLYIFMCLIGYTNKKEATFFYVPAHDDIEYFWLVAFIFLFNYCIRIRYR